MMMKTINILVWFIGIGALGVNVYLTIYPLPDTNFFMKYGTMLIASSTAIIAFIVKIYNWAIHMLIKQRKITRKYNYVTKILIETLQNVRSNIVDIPNVYSLYKDFTKILDNNYELNTIKLREEITEVMVSLKMFRTDKNNKSSFEYFAKILKSINDEYNSEREKCKALYPGLGIITLSQEERMQIDGSIKLKYIERSQTEFSTLISEFKKGDFKKEICQHIKENIH